MSNTKKDRVFVLQLNDRDYWEIAERAAVAGMSVEQLMQHFIGDLVDGADTSGSDEHMLANDWFERCGFWKAEEGAVAKLAWEGGGLLREMVHACQEYREADLEEKAARKAVEQGDYIPDRELMVLDIETSCCREQVEKLMEEAGIEETLETVVAEVLAWDMAQEKRTRSSK